MTYWQATVRYFDRRARRIGEDRLVYGWLRPEADEVEIRSVQNRLIWMEAPHGAMSASRISEIWDENR